MKILIVEDDVTLNNGIALSLGRETFEIEQAFTIAQAKKLLEESINLLILDINLPDGSGLQLCSDIRRTSHVPIILLTANDMEVDIVTGLEMGADDYITKPFSLMVLRARVNAVLRRNAQQVSVYEQGKYSFDFDKMIFLADGQKVNLSKTEQRLLKLLVFNKGNTLSRALLLDRIWPDEAEYVEENALSVTVKRLREKLPGIPLKTVYGVGYVWEK